MPNVGFGELGLVFLVILIAVGPKRMPEIVRAAGKAWRTFQDETGKAKNVFREALDEPTREFREAFEEPRREAKGFIDETRRDARAIADESRSTWAGVVDRPDPGTVTVDPHARANKPSAELGPVQAAGPPDIVAPVVDAPPASGVSISPESRLYEDT